MVKNQGTKQCEQRSLVDCWQWKANGQCSKGDNCSFRYDKDKRAKSTQPNPSPRSSTRQNVKNCIENQESWNVTIDRGSLGRRVIRNWDKIHLNVNFLMHGNWVAYFRT